MTVILIIIGILLILSGIGILVRKEVKISPLFMIVLPFWFLIKQMRGWEPEPVYTISGLPKILIGLLILAGGIGLIYFAVTIRSFIQY